ncbi:MAG: hypothetical protein K0R71_1131 [Bacillales bacterium]|jgi:chorismate mutase|nr:hypothetical protein [Bacillales bacterium]
MIIDLLNTIYEITLSMSQSVTDGDFSDFEELLNTRQALMDKVDEYKKIVPEFQYSTQEKMVLEEIIRIDEGLAPELNKHLDIARSNLNQLRTTKEFTKKYQPYSKQMNGAFIDRKN